MEPCPFVSPERGSLLLWLLTIARHTALDRLRLRSRRPVENEADDPEDTFRSIPDLDTLPEESRWRSMYFAVQSLHPDQRKVIELAYYQGLSQSEIAEVLGWPLGTVKLVCVLQWKNCERSGMKSKSKSIINGVYLLE